MAKRKDKIPISSQAGQLTGNPFGDLNLGELPSGPEDVSAVESTAAASGAIGRVVLRREKSQRGGKTVIVASGFDENHTKGSLEELARSARQQCGCGGTVRGREIELQGEIAKRVATFFEGRGFRVVGDGLKPDES